MIHDSDLDKLMKGRSGSGKSSKKQHVIHDSDLDKLMKGRYVRLTIAKLGSALGCEPVGAAGLWEVSRAS